LTKHDVQASSSLSGMSSHAATRKRMLSVDQSSTLGTRQRSRRPSKKISWADLLGQDVGNTEASHGFEEEDRREMEQSQAEKQTDGMIAAIPMQKHAHGHVVAPD
jgi:hypothetical protein